MTMASIVNGCRSRVCRNAARSDPMCSVSMRDSRSAKFAVKK
jgi:hypothetical protein